MQADLSKTQRQDAKRLSKSQAGILRGLSVEFTARQEQHGEQRPGDHAGHVGRGSMILGLMDRPQYEASTVEARRQEARQRRTIPRLATLARQHSS